MPAENPPIDAGPVIDRMRKATASASDVALGAYFQLGTSAVSGWRRRNTVPYAECVILAMRQGTSLDWLLLGIKRPPAQSTYDIAEPAIIDRQDPRTMRMARFLRAWELQRDPDDVAWLERTLARTVPEYAEWLATQPHDAGRALLTRPDKPGR